MANIIITGGAGNVASSLCRALAAYPEDQILVLDNLLTGAMEKVPLDLNNVQFQNCDVNDAQALEQAFAQFKPDYVFHYAAVVGVKRTLDHPLWVLNDIKGIENVLELSRKHSVKRVYYSSSSEVYGEPFEIPQHEVTTPLNSRLPYAIVKNVGEAYFRSYQKEFGLPYTIFRFFNTYGPNQSEDFVIPRFLRQALAGEDITIYGDGSQTRTFCYVDDNIEACVRAHHEHLQVNDTVNIGSDLEISILQLAETIIRVANSSSKIIHLPALEEGDMNRRCPDNSKMKALLGRPLLDLESGIQKLIAHYEGRS